jgi:hypothetical protein
MSGNGTAAEQRAEVPAAMATNEDGRRRVVLTDGERRKLDAVITMLRERGFGIIVGCVNGKLPDGTDACGDFAVPVERGTPDAGFACRCSRIHFLRG